MILDSTQEWDHSIRAVLLDAVGTTIIPAQDVSQTYLEAGLRYGSQLSAIEVQERFRQAFRAEEEVDRVAGYITSEQRERHRWRTIVSRTFDDISETDGVFVELWEHYSQPAAWRVIPTTMSLVKEMADHGVEIVLASNFDARLRSIVKGLPALAAIEKFAISSELGWKKPAREFYRSALEQIGLKPNEVISIGDDDINDVQGARSAGLRGKLIRPKPLNSK